MKYFTEDWFRGNLPETVIDQKIEEYNDYLDKIFMAMPFPLKILSKSISLHDAIIEKVSFNKKENVAVFELLCGDLQIGYFSLILTYLRIHKIDLELFEKKPFRILGDEFEALEDNQTYSHKMFFSDRSETEIIFEDVSFQVHKKQPVDYKNAVSQFVAKKNKT